MVTSCTIKITSSGTRFAGKAARVKQSGYDSIPVRSRGGQELLILDDFAFWSCSQAGLGVPGNAARYDEKMA
jgi:hypothetical protein